MYFRVDMNRTIASGHIMRCIAIADGYRKRGEESVFITADKEATLLLKERGYENIVLNTKWDDMDGEVDILSKIIIERNIEKMIVDSYQVTNSYFEKINPIVKIIYIDDEKRCKYNVNGIISYGNWFDKQDYIDMYGENGKTTLLLGTKYVPLRDEFRNVSEKKKDIDVLITTGGTDPYRIAEKICEYFSNKTNMKILVISKDIKQETENIKVERFVSNMSEIMMRSRMAISATGTTLFELCACKVPTIGFTFADNQIPFAKAMSKKKAIIYAGDARNNVSNVVNAIIINVEKIENDTNICGKLINEMSNIIDGNGVERIIEKIDKI